MSSNSISIEYFLFQARTKHKIELTWDTDVEALLADGYDVHYGARSIKYEVIHVYLNYIRKRL